MVVADRLAVQHKRLEATGNGEQAWAGVADAVSVDADGRVDVVIDWKSDVAPAEATLAHYRAQVGGYMRMTGARRGLVVLATSGTTLWID